MISTVPEAILPPLRTSKLPAAAALLVTAATLAGCQSGAEDSVKENLVVEVVTAAYALQPSETSLTGEIRADLSADLAFQVSGQVTERLVEIGDQVRTNQVLARVGSAEQLADAQAARAALESARSQLVQAQTALERQQSLLDQGLTTRSTYDRAVEVLATSTSSVDRAEATLEGANEALENTELRAFADGTVTARDIEVGQVVQAGQTGFTIANDGVREAVFNVDEGVLTDEFAAQSFTVQLFDNPDVRASAILSDISPTIDKTSGAVKITMKVQSPPPEMTLGSVVATTAVYLVTKAIVVPASALTYAAGVPAVWIVDPQTNTVSLREIELDSFGSNDLVITGGIEPGELIVTSGSNLVYPQQIVTPQE